MWLIYLFFHTGEIILEYKKLYWRRGIEKRREIKRYRGRKKRRKEEGEKKEKIQQSKPLKKLKTAEAKEARGQAKRLNSLCSS